MNQPTSSRLFLFPSLFLVGACGSPGVPPASNTSSGGAAGHIDGLGGSGAGGVSASGGSSGDRPLGTLNGVCFPNDDGACVSTCAVMTPVRTPNTCVEGVPTCPDGYVLFSSCPEEACAQYLSCCDETTGAFSTPTCGTDGLLTCPAGNHLADDDCIPPILNVTDCSTLDSRPCSQPNQRCTSDNIGCSCSGHILGAAHLTWVCSLLLP